MANDNEPYIARLEKHLQETKDKVSEANNRIADLVGQLANSDAQAVYDALGLREDDRCVAGVEGYALVQRNAIRLNRERVVELEHQLAVEKGRPGHDSYRDDLLKVVCAMVSSFHPDYSFDPEKVAFGAGVLLDKVYAEAAKRRA